MIGITFTDEAAQDLEEIYEYIAQDNLVAADRQIDRLQRRWEQLRDQPRLGRARDDIRAGYRSVTEGNYVIFYRLVSKEELMIMRVFHQKRDFERLLEE